MFNIHWPTLASVWNCKPNKKLRFFLMHFVSYEFFTATIIILMFFALNVTAAFIMSTSDPRLCIIHACQRGWISLYLPLVFPTCSLAWNGILDLRTITERRTTELSTICGASFARWSPEPAGVGSLPLRPKTSTPALLTTTSPSEMVSLEKMAFKCNIWKL